MKILEEKVQAVFNPVFDVITRKIELENQGEITRHIVRHAPCVSILVFDPQTLTFSLGYEYRSGVNQYRWGNAAGFIDSNETPLDAASRELEEELGLVSSKDLKKIGVISSSEGFTDEEVFIYYAEGPFDKKPTRFDSDEYVELKELTLEEFRSKVEEGIIRSAPTVTSFYWFMINKYEEFYK